MVVSQIRCVYLQTFIATEPIEIEFKVVWKKNSERG